MTPESLRRLLSLALCTVILLAVPASASKRRAVKHPSTSTADLTGTVLDSVTGLPVISARVEVGDQHDITDEQGKFLIRKVNITGSATLKVDRTGYVAQTVTITKGATQNLTIRLVPGPTVLLKKTDNSSMTLDFDSLKFGYLSGFSGYIDAEFEDFCRPDGVLVQVDRTQMAKLIGPAVQVDFAPCCKTSKIYKMNVELKDGTKTDVYFDDSCSGYSVDVIGRNHVTGKYEYVPFTQVTEIVFP